MVFEGYSLPLKGRQLSKHKEKLQKQTVELQKHKWDNQPPPLEWAEVCTGLSEVLISPLEITELWTLSSKEDLGKGWGVRG